MNPFRAVTLSDDRRFFLYTSNIAEFDTQKIIQDLATIDEWLRKGKKGRCGNQRFTRRLLRQEIERRRMREEQWALEPFTFSSPYAV